MAGIFCLGLSGVAQEPLENIEWSESRPLSWKDYAFRTFRSGRQMAITSVRHSVKGYQREEIPDFEVKVLFIYADSWTSDTTNLQLLEHEQLHFDIGELFRRKIEARIEGLRRDGEKQKAIYRYVIKKMLSEFRIFSSEYDKATRFGNLKGEQAKWKKEIWAEIKRLN